MNFCRINKAALFSSQPYSTSPEYAKSLLRVQKTLVDDHLVVCERHIGDDNPRHNVSIRRSAIKDRPSSSSRLREKPDTDLSHLPKVAIIGRPNVGKSSLFNRIVSSQTAVVCDYSGVTRDRLYSLSSWNGREFVIIDSGGIPGASALKDVESETFGKENINEAIVRQACIAVEEADVLLLVVDGQEGPTDSDRDLSQWLRSSYGSKKVIVGVNKCENAANADLQASAFFELSAAPIPVSSISGFSSGNLLDKIVQALPEIRHPADHSTNAATLSVALVGRPNVGKSSILNAIAGYERSIVSELAGTTRDAVALEIVSATGDKILMKDAAGIRKRASVLASIDSADALSVKHSFLSIQSADIVVFVLDINEGVTAQDFRISEKIAAQSKACVIVANKIDSLANKTPALLARKEKDILAHLRPISWAPVVFVSAKSGNTVKRILDSFASLSEAYYKRVPTSTLNTLIAESSRKASLTTATSLKKSGKIFYGTQVSTGPPTFVLFANDPDLFTKEDRKKIEHYIRLQVGFRGTAIRLFVRKNRA